MAQDPLTVFLGLTKPVVNDPDGEDLWGQKLNYNFDIIDQYAASLGNAVTEAPQDGKVYGRGTPTTWVPAAPLADYNDSLIEAQNTNDQQDAAIAAKEPIIAPGTTGDFWRGDKSWQPLSSITVDAWTKAQSDARYEPIDTMYTKAESDARYEPFDSAYTKAEADARYEPFDSAYTKAESAALYEPKITAGNSAYFWAGDKTWKPVPPAGVQEAPTDGKSYLRRGSDASWQAAPPAIGLVDVSDTAPSSPIDKQLWWNSSSGVLALRFNDGSSTQWVAVNYPAGSFLPTTGGTLSGDLTISKANPTLMLNASGAGQYPQVGWSNGAKQRWSFYVDTSGETGSNLGSNFAINNYNDAGAYIGTPFVISRQTGVVSAVGLAPTPAAAAAIGQWVAFNAASGAALSLPAGGTWAWAAYRVNASTGILSGILTVGLNAGGTSVMGALAGYIPTGFCWRIA